MKTRLAWLFASLMVVSLWLVGCGSDPDVSSQPTTNDGGTLPVDGGGQVTPGTDGSTPAAKNDATLSALAFSAGALTPAFAPATLAYSLTPSSAAINTTTVTATAAAAGAKITVNGTSATSGTPTAAIPITGGTTKLSIVVTAPDGTTTKTYVVSVAAVAVSGLLQPANVVAEGTFGFAVALSSDGNTLAVGAPGGGYNSVYVYTRSGSDWAQQAVVTASNAVATMKFGSALALSNDGNVLVVGAIGENSNAKGINGNQMDTSAPFAGAAYVFTRSGATWTQDVYLKASNSVTNIRFGSSVAVSGNGATVAVGAPFENSSTTGIDGNQSDTNGNSNGAVYVFLKSGAWAQQAYVKATYNTPLATFGRSVALSTDGNTLAVGADAESSNATGINGDETNAGASYSGAAHVYTRTGATWASQAYIKASNTAVNARFGHSIALSSDGNTLAIGAFQETSNATGINGNQADTSASDSGAAYVFTRSGATWAQQAYVKASNTAAAANFGASISLSSDGNTLAVGSPGERCSSTGINGDQVTCTSPYSGAAYEFKRAVTTWSQSAYVKSSTNLSSANTGASVSLSGDGAHLALGSPGAKRAMSTNAGFAEVY